MHISLTHKSSTSQKEKLCASLMECSKTCNHEKLPKLSPHSRQKALKSLRKNHMLSP